jgi:hypothetical protein
MLFIIWLLFDVPSCRSRSRPNDWQAAPASPTGDAGAESLGVCLLLAGRRRIRRSGGGNCADLDQFASRLERVLIPSIGHGWAVTFGSMGTSFNAMLSATGLSANSLAPESALFLGLACVLTGPMIAHAADGWAGVKRLLFPALVIGVVMGAVQFAVAAGAGLWNLGAFTAGLAGMAVSIWAVRWGTGRGTKEAKGALLPALSAHVSLILLRSFSCSSRPLKIGWTKFHPNQVPRKGHRFDMPARQGPTAQLLLITPGRSGLHIAGFILHLPSRRMYVRMVSILDDGQGMMSSSLSIALMVSMATIMQQRHDRSPRKARR